MAQKPTYTFSMAEIGRDAAVTEAVLEERRNEISDGIPQEIADREAEIRRSRALHSAGASPVVKLHDKFRDVDPQFSHEATRGAAKKFVHKLEADSTIPQLALAPEKAVDGPAVADSTDFGIE